MRTRYKNLHAQIREYLFEIERTKAEKTVRDYVPRLTRFSEYLDKVKDSHLTRDVAVGFLLELKEKKFGIASIGMHQQTLKTWFNWLIQRGIIDRNPLANSPIAQYHSPKRHADFAFTEAEYLIIRKHCKDRQLNEWLSAVVIAWNTGFRIGDVARLEWQNISLADRRIAFMPAKTKRFNKTVEIPILPDLFDYLSALKIEDRFVTPGLAQTYAREMSKLSSEFGQILKHCGIIGKSTHSFRSAFISRAITAGIPIGILSSITGQTIQVIQRYIHISFETRTKEMEKMT